MNNINQIKQEIANLFDEKYNEMQEISHFIFEHPEIGGEENESSQFLGETLKKHGFDVQFPYSELPTAFIATYGEKNAETTIGFLAEYDALPGFGKDGGPGHACGHNWISAVSCGCGIVLKEVADKLKLCVKVIGTPAEETFGAKYDLIRLGAFDNMDVAFQAHLDEFTSIETKALAMNSIEFTFHGLAAHAAQNPEKGINALEAVILMFNGVNSLRQHIKEKARIHGIITNGGEAPNIVPDFAQCQFSIRAEDKGYLLDMRKKIIHIAEGAALATGAKLEYMNYENPFDDMINVKTATEVCRKHLVYAGISGFIPENEYPGSGSSDIGNVSYVCPTVYMEIAVSGDEPVVVHEDSAMKLVDSQVAYDLMKPVVTSYCIAAAEMATDKEMMKKIKEEHAQTVEERMSNN